jgi:hypothetical protein
VCVRACVLSNDADVEIKIYDINGRRIKNEYRVLVELYRQDKNDLLGENMSYATLYLRFHIEWPEIQPGYWQ